MRVPKLEAIGFTEMGTLVNSLMGEMGNIGEIGI